jgi:hypothetical protein
MNTQSQRHRRVGVSQDRSKGGAGMRNPSRQRRSLVFLLLVFAILASFTASAWAAVDRGVPVSPYTTKALRVRQAMDRRFSQAEREAAAERLKQMAASRGLKPSDMMPMPGPGDPPDYFGMTPNWA